MKFWSTLFICLIISFCTFGHEGPAYPILVDKKIATNKLSIWADPDTDKGSFSFFVEGAKNETYTIGLRSWPVNDKNHILVTSAYLESEGSERSTYSAILPFDQSIMWNVEFTVLQNGNKVTSFNLPLDVTPPGPSKLEFAIYFLPFLLVGFVWIKVMIAKRKK